jgi:hypothetical protein
MNIILTIISIALLFQSTRFAWNQFKSDKSLYKEVYIKRPLDWFWAFLLVVLIFTLVILFNSVTMPQFLKWSWIQLLQSDSQGSNLIVSPFIQSGSKTVSGIFFILMFLIIPFLAKSEEYTFRDGVHTTRERIKKSLIFGLAHMIVGVPLYVALFIGLNGWFFSVRYISTYKGTQSEDIALLSATSLHAKYNFIIMIFACIMVLFS